MVNDVDVFVETDICSCCKVGKVIEHNNKKYTILVCRFCNSEHFSLYFDGDKNFLSRCMCGKIRKVEPVNIDILARSDSK